MFDFHTHTTLSDGALTPLELIRRATVKGYRAIALTDHVGMASLKDVITKLSLDCALARRYWNILAIPGVELTHVPAAAIADAAKKAKELGAWIVVVHGETIVEPTEPGTNLAAVRCRSVDILAHPGLLTAEEARLAKKNDVYIEISARKGHCLANGHIAFLAQDTGAKALLDSDAHDDSDLLTPEFCHQIVQGSGFRSEDLYNEVLKNNPQRLIDRLLTRFPIT